MLGLENKHYCRQPSTAGLYIYENYKITTLLTSHDRLLKLRIVVKELGQPFFLLLLKVFT